MEKTIYLCGAGTLGGNLAENLARTGFRRMTIIDRDRVMEENLANQPYFRADVGQPKVKALAANLYRAVGAEVSGIHQELTSGNGEKMLSAAELVIDTFDNEDSRRAVKEICTRLRKPCLHAGLSNDGYGEVIWNDHYKVPTGGARQDACDHPRNRTISLFVAAIATESLRAFINNGEKRNYSVTQKDLTISPMTF
jgi:molybdopterin-synthase adenylyltransferase